MNFIIPNILGLELVSQFKEEGFLLQFYNLQITIPICKLSKTNFDVANKSGKFVKL